MTDRIASQTKAGNGGRFMDASEMDANDVKGSLPGKYDQEGLREARIVIWDVRSFVGAGPITFGMDPKSVGRLLDGAFPNKRSFTEWDGSVRESRSLECPIIQYEKDRVNHIDIAYDVPGVSFSGSMIFDMASIDVLRLASARSNGGYVGSGLLIFPEIGISTSGFFDGKSMSVIDRGGDEPDERGIGVFPRGAFDAHLAACRPIRFD